MTFIPTANAARAVVVFQHGSHVFTNTFHFTKTSFTSGDMDNLAAAIDGYMVTWRGSIGNGISYVKTQVIDIRTVDGGISENDDNAGAGSIAQEELPVNLAVVVTLRTANRGRFARGRVYVSGFTETDITDGSWAALTISSADAYVTQIQAAGSGQGWTMVVRSIQQDGVPLTNATTRAVTLIEVRSAIPGTQRRRLDRP